MVFLHIKVDLNENRINTFRYLQQIKNYLTKKLFDVNYCL